jgi:SAM-dependent methyltransferase
MATFKDHFSTVAGAYRSFRPGYPAALFDWLAAVAPRRDAALDCGCGSGQASVALAAHFARVEAIDPAAEQLRHATPHPRVTYRVAPAEQTGLPDASVDLVLAAQAFHWFELARFHAEVRRVSRPGAVLAAVTYALCQVDRAVDGLVAALYGGTLDGDWPPERRHIEDGYRSLPFPFPELVAPPLAMVERWTADRFLGYLATWSAVSAHRRRTGHDPVTALAPALRAAWGTGERQVTWPLSIRAGVVSAPGAAD